MLVTLNLTLKAKSFVDQIKFFKQNASFFIAYSNSISSLVFFWENSFSSY